MTYLELLQSQAPLLVIQSTGATLADVSGNGHVFNAGTSLTHAGGFRHSSISNSYRSAVTSAQTVGTVPYFGVTPTSNLFTISFWLKTDSPTGSRVITGVGGSRFCVNWSQATLGISTFPLDDGNMRGISAGLVADGRWHHVAFQFDSNNLDGSIVAYVDGVAQSVQSVGVVVNHDVAGTMNRFTATGAYIDSTTYVMPDHLSEIMALSYWDRTLTATEITDQAAFNFGSEFNDYDALIWEKKPRALYKFWLDETGTTINDNSLYADHMTIVDGGERLDEQLPVEGEIKGGAFKPSVGAGYSMSSKIINVNTVDEYSYEVWISLDAYPVGQTMVFGHSEQDGGWGEGLSLATNGEITYFADTTTQLYFGTFALDLNRLYHVVLTRSAGARRLYVNGVMIGASTNVGNPTSATDALMINRNYAAQTSATWRAFNGKVYQAVFYDRRLTAADVEQHYAAGMVELTGEVEYKSTVLAKNPLAYYPIEVEGGGATFLVDASGNGRGMNLQAGGTIVDQSYVSASSGAPASTVAIPLGKTTMSFEFWMQRTGDPSHTVDEQIGGLVDAGNTSLRSGLTYNRTTHMSRFFAIRGTTSEGETEKAWAPFKLGQWYHVAVTIDRATNDMRYYINGALVGGNAGVALNVDPVASIRLELGAHNTNYQFIGMYKHIAVYDRVLLPSEIRQHYNLRRPIPTSTSSFESSVLADDPMLYYPLIENTGNVVTDARQAYTAALTGTADVMAAPTLNPYHHDGNSLLFNGTSNFVDMTDPMWYCIRNRFAFECVFEYDGSGVETALIRSAEQGGFEIRIHTNNQLEFRINKHDDILYWHTLISSNFTINGLNHMVAMFDGRNMVLYVNGVRSTLDIGRDVVVRFTKHVPNYIGARPEFDSNVTTPGRFFIGRIGHVALFDKMLDHDVIQRRTRILLGDTMEYDGYTGLIMSSNPDFYLPLNDQNNDYANHWLDIGKNSVHPHIWRTESPGSILYNQPELFPGGGPCIKFTNKTNNGSTSIILNGDFTDVTHNSISAEAWFKVDLSQITTELRIFTHGGPGVEDESLNVQSSIAITPSGAVTSLWEYGGGTNYTVSFFPAGTYISNTPAHIVLVRDDVRGVVYCFLNGIKSTLYVNKPPTGGSGARFMIGYDYASYKSDSWISHVAIYGRVLSDNEITEHYYTPLGIDPAGYDAQVLNAKPIVSWKFDGTQFVDAMGNYSYTVPATVISSEGAYKGSTGGARFEPGVDIGGGAASVTPFEDTEGGSFAIEFWVHPESNGVVYVESNGSSVYRTVEVRADGRIRVFFGSDAYSTGAVSLHQPSHVVINVSPTNVEFILNGIIDSIKSHTLAGAGRSEFAIGGALGIVTSGWETSNFRGIVDRVSIFDRTVTLNEAKARFDVGITGATYRTAIYNKHAVRAHFPYNSDQLEVRRQIAPTVTGAPSLIPSDIDGNALSLSGGDSLSYTIDTTDAFTSFTVVTWFKPTGAAGDLIAKRWAGVGLYLKYDGAGGFAGSMVQATTGNFEVPVADHGVVADEWHHVAMAFDSLTGTLRIVLDGATVFTESRSAFVGANPGTTQPWIIGSGFAGELDETLVFLHSLNDVALSELAGTGFNRYAVDGVVTQDGLPVVRKARLYDRTTGQLVSTAQSDPSTGKFEFVMSDADPTRQYFVVVLDDDDPTELSPIARDRLIAVEKT